MIKAAAENGWLDGDAPHPGNAAAPSSAPAADGILTYAAIDIARRLRG